MKGRVITVDFTKNFMDELAAYIGKEYIAAGRSLRRLAVVFGGKRPALFLKRELARRYKQVIELPDFFTIDDLMMLIANGGGYTASSSGELDECFEIFRLVREHSPELLDGREDFARFLPWARELRAFIGQADLEDVLPDRFLNIEASARIGFPVPEGVNCFFRKVSGIRNSFHSRLLERGMASRGMQYLRAQKVAEQENLPGYDEIILANFFYFHRTEESVVRSLYQRGQATLFFQGDQRKWDVLARVADKFSCEIKEADEPVPVVCELKVYAAYDAHSEVAIARDVLGSVSDLERAVLVVPDAGTLVPLLSFMPASVKSFNVSMGYPLNRGSLYVLLRSLFLVQSSCRGGRYYSRDYLDVLRHPFVVNLNIFGDSAILRVLLRKIEEALTGCFISDLSGRLFFELSDIFQDDRLWIEAASFLRNMDIQVDDELLRSGLKEVHKLCFELWQEVDTLFVFTLVLKNFLDLLTQGKDWVRYPLNVSTVERIREVADEFSAVSFSLEKMLPEQIFMIFMDRIEREIVRFTGAPLRGLQVLGLFETRSLSFDDVIVLDVNEGVLPSIDVRSSLIPREVLVLLGLDRMEEEDAIQRYQFMRLISSARRVHLIYQDTKEKSPSRFLEELVWEEQKKRGNVVPFPTERAGFLLQPALTRRKVNKTPLMLEFLSSFVFSATSVNMYMQNPFRFYQTYVLGLREHEDMLDEPDNALVGKFWHGLLEELFKPFIGKTFSFVTEDIVRAWKLFEEFFTEYFSRRMRADAFLVKAVAEQKFRAFLEDCSERPGFVKEILAVEKKWEGSIPLTCGNASFRVVIDRLDLLRDDQLLVLDYKTGAGDKMPPAELLLPENMDRKWLYKNVRSFQLPLYIYFAAREFPGRSINAGFYRLRDAKMEAISSNGSLVVPQKFLTPYLLALNFLVSQIMDPLIPFEDDELRKIKGC